MKRKENEKKKRKRGTVLAWAGFHLFGPASDPFCAAHSPTARFRSHLRVGPGRQELLLPPVSTFLLSAVSLPGEISVELDPVMKFVGTPRVWLLRARVSCPRCAWAPGVRSISHASSNRTPRVRLPLLARILDRANNLPRDAAGSVAEYLARAMHWRAGSARWRVLPLRGGERKCRRHGRDAEDLFHSPNRDPGG